MLKVVQDADAFNENTVSSSLLDEIGRNGARQMLAAALQAEVIAYTASPPPISGRRWSSSSAPGMGCRRPRSPG
jgi:hypothetical protein